MLDITIVGERIIPILMKRVAHVVYFNINSFNDDKKIERSN